MFFLSRNKQLANFKNIEQNVVVVALVMIFAAFAAVITEMCYIAILYMTARSRVF